MPSHTQRLFQKLCLGMTAVTTQICVTNTESVIHLLRRAVSIICIYKVSKQFCFAAFFSEHTLRIEYSASPSTAHSHLRVL